MEGMKYDVWQYTLWIVRKCIALLRACAQSIVNPEQESFLERSHACCRNNKLSSESPVVIMHKPAVHLWVPRLLPDFPFFDFFFITFEEKDIEGKTCLTRKEA